MLNSGGNLFQGCHVGFASFRAYLFGLLYAGPPVFALRQLLQAPAPFHDIHQVVYATLLHAELLYQGFRLEHLDVAGIEPLDESLAQP